MQIDPVRGFFGETAFAGAANNDGNDGHALLQYQIETWSKIGTGTMVRKNAQN